MSTASHAELVSRLRAGGEDAAAAIVRRFAARLVALARARLDADVRLKEDPEDVVQSVLRSFFTRCQDGQFTLEDKDSLWTILTVITVRKCVNRIEYHRAARRDLSREVSFSDLDRSWAKFEAIAREPTPAEAATLAEMLEGLMSGLEPRERAILSLHLQGYSQSEISREVGRAERTVRRTIELIRKRLRQTEAAEEDS